MALVIVVAEATASINDVTISDGVGAPQDGGILNLGTLNLDRVTVSNNTETSGAPIGFDLGGGGIYKYPSDRKATVLGRNLSIVAVQCGGMSPSTKPRDTVRYFDAPFRGFLFVPRQYWI